MQVLTRVTALPQTVPKPSGSGASGDCGSLSPLCIRGVTIGVDIGEGVARRENQKSSLTCGVIFFSASRGMLEAQLEMREFSIELANKGMEEAMLETREPSMKLARPLPCRPS
mmetsp:Transcript_34116/g.77251  ORF Transcript_34116/g.77251 Transcript_34116/m.77251 type:complete len:113 (+) Transcript_34116:1223-1561(+)